MTENNKVDMMQLMQRSDRHLVCFCLLTNEYKLSVLNFTIQRTENYQEPVKSKEELIFMVISIFLSDADEHTLPFINIYCPSSLLDDRIMSNLNLLWLASMLHER
jgi:hypothetical protein